MGGLDESNLMFFKLNFVPNLLQVISDVEVTQLVAMIRQYGMEFKEALVYDRIREELRIFCANHTIDEVYNTMFLVSSFTICSTNIRDLW